jgi:hypothetical protein
MSRLAYEGLVTMAMSSIAVMLWPEAQNKNIGCANSVAQHPGG